MPWAVYGLASSHWLEREEEMRQGRQVRPSQLPGSGMMGPVHGFYPEVLDQSKARAYLGGISAF
jgi:hypothetical protein